MIRRWQAARGYPTTGFLNKLQHKALLTEIVATHADQFQRRFRRSSVPPSPAAAAVAAAVAAAAAADPGAFIGGVMGGMVGGMFRH